MAKPRVFISSTFFDLKSIRADLERFVKELGFEPVLNERGTIPYGSDAKPEDYAYKEIELCDIVVAVIGGKFGTKSSAGAYSISQMELKRAVELGRQVYVFVERAVSAEFATYKKNKGKAGVEYSYVDNIKVYEFLEEVEVLPRNNATATFETSRDITDYLAEQWAGLLQRFLRDTANAKQFEALRELQATAKTLHELVTYLTAEKQQGNDAIKHILLSNHPIFLVIAKATSTPYRLFFATKSELVTWLNHVGFAQSSPTRSKEGEVFSRWTRKHVTAKAEIITSLFIQDSVFDKGGALRIYTPSQWNDSWVRSDVKETPMQTYVEIQPDDIPF